MSLLPFPFLFPLLLSFTFPFLSPFRFLPRLVWLPGVLSSLRVQRILLPRFLFPPEISFSERFVYLACVRIVDGGHGLIPREAVDMRQPVG